MRSYWQYCLIAWLNEARPEDNEEKVGVEAEEDDSEGSDDHSDADVSEYGSSES